MEEPRHKLTRQTMGVVLILLMVALLVFLYFHYFGKNKPTSDTEANTTSSETADQNNGSTGNSVQDTADGAYQMARDQINQKDYSAAISSLDQAIRNDPYQPSYYSEESEVYYNLGKKDEAIKTLQDGVAANPDDDLLKSKLDVMQKDTFNSAGNESNVRE